MSEQNFEIPDSAGRVTALGRAFAFVEERWERAKAARVALHKASQGFQLAVTPSASKPEILAEIERERDVVTRQRAHISPLLGELYGPDTTQAQIHAYLGAKKDLLDALHAEERGLLDTRESAEGIEHLREALAQARWKLSGSTADRVDQGSGLKAGWKGTKAAEGLSKGLGLIQEGVQGALGQLGGVFTGLMSLTAGMPIAGGLFGLLLFGQQEADRLRAQTGEMVNLAVAGGAEQSSKGAAWLGAFQERAQNFYGISKAEIQANAKAFINAGIAFDDIFKAEDRSLGEVGHDAVTMSVALDRHFELGSGTTARIAAEAVRSYGMNLKSAVHLLGKLEFAAQKGGFGVGAFVNWTLQATQQVRHLGIGMDEAAAAALELQRSYRAKGAGATQSAALAEQSTGEITGGLGQMGLGREIWLAGELGLGGDLYGRERLREGLFQPGGGGDPEMLKKAVLAWNKDARKHSTGNDLHARYYLEQQGFGFEGARGILELAKKFEKGLKVQDLDVHDKKMLKEAFLEEGKKVSDNQKNWKTVMAGMAKAGQGAMVILSNFSAIAIMGMKSILMLLAGSDEEKKQVWAKMQEYSKNIAGGWHAIAEGSGQVALGIQRTLGPIFEPIGRAIRWQYTGGQPSAFDTAPDASEAGSELLIDRTFQSLTGRSMTEADRAILFGGLGQAEAHRLMMTPAGRAELVARTEAQIAKLKAEAVRTPGGGRSGPGAKGAPPGQGSSLPALHGLDGLDHLPNLGSLDRRNPLAPEPLPKGVSPHAALHIERHWEVTDPSQPLEVEVHVSWG